MTAQRGPRLVARRHVAALTLLRASRFWRDQGKRTGARDLLAPVYGWFTEGAGCQR